jgi:MarR family transcriptional regulator, negative regulator of the multidrug operon emrRAB
MTGAVELEKLAVLLQQSVRACAAQHGLLPVQFQALDYIARANRYSDFPVAVSEYLGTTRGTVSQTLAVLERRGLITKHRDAAHGKLVHLKVTQAGDAVLARAWSGQLRSLLQEDGVDPDDTMLALVPLLRALQKLNGNQAFGECQRCAHFQITTLGYQCGLTGELLASEQIVKLCREWTPAPEKKKRARTPKT